MVETQQYAIQQRAVELEFLDDNLLFYKLTMLGQGFRYDIPGTQKVNSNAPPGCIV